MKNSITTQTSYFEHSYKWLYNSCPLLFVYDGMRRGLHNSALLDEMGAEIVEPVAETAIPHGLYTLYGIPHAISTDDTNDGVLGEVYWLRDWKSLMNLDFYHKESTRMIRQLAPIGADDGIRRCWMYCGDSHISNDPAAKRLSEKYYLSPPKRSIFHRNELKFVL